MSDVNYFKCACPHCDGHIEFPTSIVGQLIDCPHCRQKMKLPAPAPTTEPPPIMDRKTCPTCGGPLDPAEENCPICSTVASGTESEPTGKGKLVPIMGVVLALAGVGAALFWRGKFKPAPAMPVADHSEKTKSPPLAKSAEKTEPPAKAAKSLADLKSDSVKLEKAKDGNLVYATGTVKNDSEYQRFGVKIEIELLDASGRKVGTATDYIQVMEPRDDWHFRALVNDSKTVEARIASLKED